MKNLQNIIEQLKTDCKLMLHEQAIKDLIHSFSFNLSLHYPDKAILPLNEFSQFYFKELTELKFKDRLDRAYNDTLSSCVQEIFTPTKDGYASLTQFREINEPILKSYAEKAIFTKFFSQGYIHSKKTAREMVDSDKTMMRIIDRELPKYVSILG